ncbi:hypothetical protein [Sphingopyxis flava]|uniref:PRC-barrel domain-containing protein n=1 Tax=Sphingopyxis flava TaxID=1507287 RepID=A0A1T5CLU1_9SPHN|nr:hypothetical protein [Sphingopyxis flava]SKB60120.1 hypothetical protein SAMN06295937_1010158 [Sphingopyxis flava]
MEYRTLISAAALIASTLVPAAPASAQLLGGGGRLGGGLGGTLGGTLGNPTAPIGGTIGTAGDIIGSGRGDIEVDRRSGRVRGEGDADARGQGSAGADLLGDRLGAEASGSGRASGSGSVEAQSVGTDFVGETARGAVGTMRGVASTATGTARDAVGPLGDRASSTLSNASGSATGSGSAAGSFQGSLGQLAATGSGAASGDGMFAVAPGMPIADPRGKVIGYVHDVRQTGGGVVEAVSVEVGDRVATLPAASFSGAGNMLVTGMTKGELKEEAKRQEAAAD